MHMDKEPEWLNGRLIVAMPGMDDPNFMQTVILLCAHDANGAMGLVINRPYPLLPIEAILAELNLDIQTSCAPCPLLAGGPVEPSRGFLLHSRDYTSVGTVPIGDGFALSGTVQAIEDTVKGQGPKDSILCLGYAGWGAGQLEDEIRDGGWLVVPAQAGLVFHTAVAEKWTSAITSMGINPAHLSSVVGHA